MKHIKYFESESERLYREVTYDEYWPNKYEIPVRYRKILRNTDIRYRKYRVEGRQLFNNYIIIDTKLTSYTIRYSMDEYFYVDQHSILGHSYFKCDQWHGLNKFFNDRNIYLR